MEEERVSSERDGINVDVQKVAGKAGTVIIRCVGYIDTYTSPSFTELVDAAIKDGAKYLIFDLAKVTYISSSGIGCFTSFLKGVKPKEGDIVLVSLNPRVLEMFELMGFAMFFKKADTVDEALGFFPEGKAAPKVPFAKMEAITDSFAKLERVVAREKRPEFYSVLVGLLKQILELKN